MSRRVSREPLLFSQGIPSNFYMNAPIVLPNPVQVMKGDDYFKSNEHYFHCCKVALSPEASIDMYREIRDASIPRVAKSLGRRVPLEPEDIVVWDNFHAPIAMLTCNLAKFGQNEHCLDWLRKTDNRPLVEHRPDRIWGDGMDGSGMNLLGRTLEIVRVRLR